MAGFGVFRTYQKASMVALAILAMLAFFVLPPLLQYGGQSASLADTPVATWNGGEVREKGLDRAVMMKFVVNRFLQEAAMAAGRDPAQATRFDVDERSVVTMMLLAEEAKKNGIVVSDAAINDFLAKETNGQVGADQFEQIMGGLRAGGSGVSQHDLFEALRQELLAQNMLLLLQRGLFGNPPGLRWDYFRRLTQSATAEVVPVDVRSVSAEVDLGSIAAKPCQLGKLTAQEAQRGDLRERGATGECCVFGRGDKRRSPKSHDRVANKLVHDAKVFLDRIGLKPEMPVQHAHHVGWGQSLGGPRKSHQIAEGNRHDLPVSTAVDGSLRFKNPIQNARINILAKGLLHLGFRTQLAHEEVERRRKGTDLAGSLFGKFEVEPTSLHVAHCRDKASDRTH